MPTCLDELTKTEVSVAPRGSVRRGRHVRTAESSVGCWPPVSVSWDFRGAEYKPSRLPARRGSPIRFWLAMAGSLTAARAGFWAVTGLALVWRRRHQMRRMST
jgi:hypothetical protein